VTNVVVGSLNSKAYDPLYAVKDDKVERDVLQVLQVLPASQTGRRPGGHAG
jgi:hypothetical protein